MIAPDSTWWLDFQLSDSCMQSQLVWRLRIYGKAFYFRGPFLMHVQHSYIPSARKQCSSRMHFPMLRRTGEQVWSATSVCKAWQLHSVRHYNVQQHSIVRHRRCIRETLLWQRPSGGSADGSRHWRYIQWCINATFAYYQFSYECMVRHQRTLVSAAVIRGPQRWRIYCNRYAGTLGIRSNPALYMYMQHTLPSWVFCLSIVWV